MSIFAAPLAAAAIALGCVGCADYFAGEAWSGYEQSALVLGKMRLERRPEGMPVSRLALADNFRRIAFGMEEGVLDGRHGLESAAGRLRRWRQPVRWHVTSLGDAATDYAESVAATSARIAAATGHDIRKRAPGEMANFAVLFLRPQDYAPAASSLRRRPLGGWLATQVERFGKAGHTPCIGLFLHARRPGASETPSGNGMQADEILFGLALIRDGLPPRLARACVEEELAQAMGLPNDDPNVRPSVFNDDQEFALLTIHDEALLRILYDPRLSAGMTEEEAMAIVPDIIADLDTDAISGRQAPAPDR